jgi:hypothetical protein
MQNEDKEQSIIEETVTILSYSPKKDASKENLFEELRANTRFLQAHQLNSSSIENFTKEEQEQANASIENNITPEQTELNLAISQIISGTISSENEIASTSENTETTGFSWGLSLRKRFTHTSADLLLYALSEDMFEYNNTDHKMLLNNGILECITTHTTSDKLVEILAVAKEKLAGKVTIADETAIAARNWLMQKQEEKHTFQITSYAQLATYEQEECKLAITALQEQYKATMAKIFTLANQVNTVNISWKKTFTEENHAGQQVLSSLRKLSAENIVPITPNSAWNTFSSINNNIFKTIESTSIALNAHKSAIEDLSKYLQIEDKQ